MNRRLPPRLRAWTHAVRCRLPGVPRPHAAHLILTWRCNLACGACEAWRREPVDELPAAAWEEVFAELPSLDVVKIIGGEPFLRADLAEVVGAIRQRVDPYVLQVVTNGTLTDATVALAAEHGWPGLHLRVSLDGLGATHDRARGVEGAFERALSTLRRLAAVPRRRFTVAVNYTVTEESLAELDAVIAACRPLGVDVVPGFRVAPFQRHCDTSRVRHATRDLGDGQAALRRLAARDHGARAGFTGAERAVLAVLNGRVFRKHVAGGTRLGFPCQELRHLAYLDPAGSLVTCGLDHAPLGNVAREGFAAVWGSGAARAARARVERCPGCMQGAVEVLSALYA